MNKGKTFTMKKNIIIFFKGLLIGGTMLVPGVSGGSMAMILGIYHKLISSISSFRTNKKRNNIFLIIFILGAGSGMLLFANSLLNLIEKYPMPMMYLFSGAVIGGIPIIYKESKVNSFSWKNLICILIGFLSVIIFSAFPENTSISEISSGFLRPIFLILSGFVSAIALILPGISVSYMLLLMGLYDETMKAIGNLDILFLLPMLIGILTGILLTTKILEQAMQKYPAVTYFIILGFVAGSLIEAFPGIPNGFEWLLCGITAIAGFLAIQAISRLENNKHSADNN